MDLQKREGLLPKNISADEKLFIQRIYQMYLVLNKMLVGWYFSLTIIPRCLLGTQLVTQVCTFVQDIPVTSIVDRKAFTVTHMSQMSCK